MEMAREVFETNILGRMAVTRGVLPQFGQRKTSVIFNIRSSMILKRWATHGSIPHSQGDYCFSEGSSGQSSGTSAGGLVQGCSTKAA
jgi:NAD(P)-dependent dehydrogenase (short-subunit alcohol dehydrogenase family)